ncbi:MAG: restriction endonuclease subunit S [Bacilli bacterium]
MMSKLNELIKELCPNGVEYKPLKLCTEMKRGTSVTKKDVTDGNIPVISGGREPAYMCDKYNRENETITVAGSGAGAGYVQYWNKPIFVCDAFSVKGVENVSEKYIFYCLENIQEKIYSTKKGSGVPHVHISSIENFPIPLPPLPVQEEIVHILDNFKELTTELTTELTARKKQYEYYRDSLLVFDDEIKYKLFGEVAKIQRGASPRPIAKFITEEENGIPWIKIGDTTPNSKYVNSTDQKITKEGASKSRILKKGDFIISNSMSFGRPYILNIDGAIHDGWASISNFNGELNSDFLYHFLSSKQVQHYWNNRINNGSVSNLNADIIKSLLIPIPPLSEQQRIVDILDRFDILCNDVSSGLPGEIKARQQQYEYYRKKLLTFKNIDAEV